MLTCEICGEEILLEEDMKTHLLLDHMENNMHCPLCSLSGVSYDELCFHISSAHPEKQQTAQTGTQTTSTHTELTSQSCDTAHEVSHSGASGVTIDSVQLKHNSISESGSLSLEDTGALSSTNVTKESSCECSQASRSLDRHESVSHCSESVCDGLEPDHSKAKQKRLSSSRKERLFSCPMCALVFSSSGLLQEHVEMHLEERSTAEGEKRLECPMCSVVCSDDIFLQEHVELHLDHDTAGNSAAGSPGSDLKLARQLQQQEEEQRRRQEDAQEAKEFKKLQRQFGVDGRGGYRRQMERTMERAVASGLMAPSEFHCKRAEMMESLASGVDDGRTRTQGVVRALYEYYQSECKDCAHVWLSADTDHYCSSEGDKGWGCGYRNIQMLISSLHNIDMFSSVLKDKAVPSIPRVQSMIEEAWKEGLDPQGASHFNQQMQRTRAWIGATEIYCLLTSLGISSCIIDFHQPTGPGDTHPRLFEWAKQYYCQTSRGSRLSPRLVQTSLPPLYLQHQGHSRSVVGLEQRKNGNLCLLVLDPGSSVSDTRKLLSRDTIATAIRHVRKIPSSLKHKQYQVVAVQGVLSAEEKRISIFNSRTLCAERIP